MALFGGPSAPCPQVRALAKAAALLDELVAVLPPAVIRTATGFAVRDAANGPLATLIWPVLQVVWRAGADGLDPGAAPELVILRPVADRTEFVAKLARGWARLRIRRPAERRIALVLADDPDYDGGTGDGGVRGTPPAAVAILRALAGAGYRVADLPDSPEPLIGHLLDGPTNANPGAPAEEFLSFAEYSTFFATLPSDLQQAVAARWGGAERDPFFRPGRLDCGHIAIPGFRQGNVAVLIQPARDNRVGAKSAHRDPASAPPHCWLAAYAWLAVDFRADAVIYLGEHSAARAHAVLRLRQF